MKTSRSLVNGKASQSIDIFDRGLLYGDGVFETILVQNHRIPLWSRHIERLESSCQHLNIECPDSSLLLSEARGLLKGCVDAVLRITVTRGTGKRGYRPSKKASPSRIISVLPHEQSVFLKERDAVILRLCETRLGNHALAGLKHMNRLEQVIAQSEWSEDDGFDEGVMLNNNDDVIECTMSNIFLIKNKNILTPNLNDCGVKGVMRQCVIDSVQNNNMSVLEKPLSLTELRQADEVLITNSVMGIRPVKCFQQNSWPTPGKMTQAILALVEKELADSGVTI